MFEAYVQGRGRSVPTPAVLALDPAHPIAPTGSDQHRDLRDAAHVGFLLAAASHDYFRSDHFEPNASNFFLEGRLVVPGKTGLVLSGRMRCGVRQDAGYDYSEYRFPAPPHVVPFAFLGGDERLRSALAASWTTTLGPRIRLASFWYARANSCDPAVPLEAEVALLATAFEVLLDAPTENPKSTFMVRRIGELLPGGQASPAGPPMRPRPRQAKGGNSRLPMGADAWSAIQFWLDDFYHLRNCISHAGRDSRPDTRAWASWSIVQHLVVGTSVFPVAAKAVLREAGLYEWQPRDDWNLGEPEGFLLYPGFRFDGEPHEVCCKNACNVRLWGR
jgi:hypothetical protein